MAKTISIDKVEPITFVSSGIKEIDEMTGGYPRGRVTQVYGQASVGKTSLMLQCLSNISQTSRVLFCDVENALNIDRVKQLGADGEKIDYNASYELQEVCILVREAIATNKYDLIVVDSVAMMTPREELAGETGEQFVGLKPRLLGQWLRQIEGELANSKTALVLINQLRKNMSIYGNPHVVPGGMQLEYSSSLMLQLSANKSTDIIKKDKVTIGHWVHVKVTKSKVSKPYEETKFKLKY